jgi:hypothetical protein
MRYPQFAERVSKAQAKAMLWVMPSLKDRSLFFLSPLPSTGRETPSGIQNAVLSATIGPEQRPV